jgi:hypothetical protein
MDIKQKLEKLLQPLFQSYDKTMTPASSESIANFRKKAHIKGVPSSVIGELTAFYEVTNGIPCLDSFDFHSCEDEILYEWWDSQELWLAQRDFYTLRWAKGKFCLGDASSISFSKEDEHMTLLDLIESAMKQWYPEGPDE